MLPSVPTMSCALLTSPELGRALMTVMFSSCVGPNGFVAVLGYTVRPEMMGLYLPGIERFAVML